MTSPPRFLAACAVVLAVSTSACSTDVSSTAPAEVSSTAASSTVTLPFKARIAAQNHTLTAGSHCRTGDPLANVYHSYRLIVKQDCKTVTGTVESIRTESDGDIHFDLGLDFAYASLVNNANRDQQHGWLVAEIVPADEPGCIVGDPPRPPSGSYDYGTCTGKSVRTPGIGSHVSITGPYADDTIHGWMEIHPVWYVTLLSGFWTSTSAS